MSPGGQSQTLAELAVAFTTKGFAPLQAAQAAILDATGKLAEKINAVGAKIDAAIAGAGKAVEAVGQKTVAATALFDAMSNKTLVAFSLAGNALKIAAISAMGFATAGIAAAGVGTSLSFWMERLALTVAGLFGPEIRVVIRAVADFTLGLQALTDVQKEAIARLLELTTAFRLLSAGGVMGTVGGIVMLALASDRPKPLLGAVGQLVVKLADAIAPLVQILINLLTPALDALAKVVAWLAENINENVVKWGIFLGAFALALQVIPMVVSAIMSVVAALKALAAAQTYTLALGGPKGWATIALALGAAAAATKIIGDEIDKASAKADKITRSRMPEMKKLGGIESIDAQWTRLATAAIAVTGNMGKSPAEETNDRLADMLDEQRRTTAAIENKPAAVERG